MTKGDNTKGYFQSNEDTEDMIKVDKCLNGEDADDVNKMDKCWNTEDANARNKEHHFVNKERNDQILKEEEKE